jgi:hypothetical protein
VTILALGSVYLKINSRASQYNHCPDKPPPKKIDALQKPKITKIPQKNRI